MNSIEEKYKEKQMEILMKYDTQEKDKLREKRDQIKAHRLNIVSTLENWEAYWKIGKDSFWTGYTITYLK